jgi:hypothetical protein
MKYGSITKFAGNIGIISELILVSYQYYYSL